MLETRLNTEENNSISSFWKERKDQISICAFLIATGGIFLTISEPSIDSAKTALHSIQFIWLILISTAFIWLGISFVKFAYEIEIHLEKKFDVELQANIMAFALVLGGTLIFNLWEYLISLYTLEWITFIGLTQTYITLICVAFFARYQAISFHKYWSNQIAKYFLLNFVRVLFFALIPTFWTTILKLNFDLSILFRAYVIYILAFSLVVIFGTLYILYRQRHPKPPR